MPKFADEKNKRIIVVDIVRKYRNNAIIDIIYQSAPRFIQNLVYSSYGYFKYLEYKKLYKDSLIEYEREEKLPYEEIKKLQLVKLKSLLIHANQHSDYYKKIFKDNNFVPEDMISIDDLKRLPILSKKTILDNYDAIVTDNYLDFDPLEASSGGTTGTTLNFLLDKNTYLEKESQAIHYWKRHNYRVGEYKTIMYRAGVLIPKGAKIEKPWRIDYARKMLYLSSYYGSDDLYQQYYKLLKNWKPKFMQFLPSAVYLFAKYLNENNLTIELEKAFSASEMLHSFQKVEIERAFKCKIIDHYGHGEPGIYVAGQCTNGNYHIPTNDVIAEVLDDGTLLETSLNNYSMPFIRYRVGDKVSGYGYGCSCGIQTPYFRAIEGRESSQIYTADGRLISSIGFDQIFKGNNIRLGQIIQKKKGELTLNLVVETNFSKEDQESIVSKLQDRVGRDTQVFVSYMDDIPKAKSGKYNLVISSIKQSEEE